MNNKEKSVKKVMPDEVLLLLRIIASSNEVLYREEARRLLKKYT